MSVVFQSGPSLSAHVLSNPAMSPVTVRPALSSLPTVTLTRDFHLHVTQVVNVGNVENHVYVKIFTYTFSRIRQKSHVYVQSAGIESICIFHVEAVAVDQQESLM